MPDKEVTALLPEQADLLLDAAALDLKPWLQAWTVLAATKEPASIIAAQLRRVSISGGGPIRIRTQPPRVRACG